MSTLTRPRHADPRDGRLPRLPPSRGDQIAPLAQDPDAPRLHVDAGTPAWRLVLRAAYVVIRPAGPLARLLVRLRLPTFEDRIVELALVGRRTGRPRPVLLTLIRLGGHWYVGHPNGPRAWLANLAAADTVELLLPGGRHATVRPSALPLGPERDAVVRATADQQPFGVRTVYRAAQRHILRAGIYYRLEQIDQRALSSGPASDGGPPDAPAASAPMTSSGAVPITTMIATPTSTPGASGWRRRSQAKARRRGSGEPQPR